VLGAREHADHESGDQHGERDGISFADRIRPCRARAPYHDRRVA
jgi:hypothetical protein